ncbi:MAG TPA: IS5 family transposase [Terriglobales bacterium]|nr:IS5 family transposase [Terriglobales bacterium]
MHLSDAQWEAIRPLLREKRRADGRGRPWREARAVLDGVLWILRTGARWRDLPREYPPYQTCHRRFQQWVREGRLERILRALAEDLLLRGALDLEEAFIDASFSSAKKGANCVGPTRRGKGTKIMAIADRHGLPLALWVTSASPHESRLVEATLRARFCRATPPRLVGDTAYDSDPLDQRLRQQFGVELIAPHTLQRSRPASQDGRALRRYRRRWRIERLFAWLHNYRRVVTRWEYHAANFLGMVQLACVLVLLRHL